MLASTVTAVGTIESPGKAGTMRFCCEVAAPITPRFERGYSVSVAVVVPETTYRKLLAEFTARATGAALKVIVSCLVSTPLVAMEKCTTFLLVAFAT